MNTKSLAILFIAFLVNLNIFESSEMPDQLKWSPESFCSVSPGSSCSGSSRMFDLAKDCRDLIKRSRKGIEGKLWDALDDRKYETANELKKKRPRFSLDGRDQDNIDNLAILLGTDETPFATLDFLYQEHAQIFRDFGEIEWNDNPFFSATSRNIEYLKTNHSDDTIMMENIQKASDARRSGLIDGADSPYE